MTTSSTSATQGSGALPAPAAAAPHRAVLPIVLVGPLLSSIDFFIVNVAIPSVQSDLHTSAAMLQLIIAGYALTYGCGMIVGGRLGDLFGRKKIFALGILLFTLASTACGAAPTGGFLLGARLVQGLAASLMVPQVLAIFSTVFTGEARAKAINWYGFVLGLGAAFGQLIGGVLIKLNIFGLDWRSCFLVNLPIGIIGFIAAVRYVPESRAPGKPQLDLLGMVWITSGLLAVVLPLTEGREQGWPVWTWVLLAASAPLFIGFGLYQNARRDRGSQPLMDMRLFKERAFTAGLLTQLVFWCGQASFFLVFAIYLQSGRMMTALNAGLLFGALGIGYMVSSMGARVVAKRLGRQTIALGGLLRVVALIPEIIIVTHIGVGGHIQWLIPALFVDGAGMGLAVAPLASTVLSRVTPSHAGSAAGMLTTGVQVGNSLGVALIGLIFYRLLGAGGGAAYARAFTDSLYFLIGIGVVVALLVQILPRRAATA